MERGTFKSGPSADAAVTQVAPLFDPHCLVRGGARLSVRAEHCLHELFRCLVGGGSACHIDDILLIIALNQCVLTLLGKVRL